MSKKKEKKETKEASESISKTSEQFKRRNFSDVGTSVLDDLKKATEAERKHRQSEKEG